MNDKLDLILKKLEVIESGQKELNQAVRAIHDRQEETDAKLEALAMDMHHIKGELTRLEEKVDANHEAVMSELSDLKSDVEFTYQKASRNELELHRLRRN